MLVCTFGIFSQKLFHPLACSLFIFSLFLSCWQSKLFVVGAVDHAHIHIECLRKFFLDFFLCRLFFVNEQNIFILGKTEKENSRGKYE